MSFFSDASLVLVPSGVKDSKVYSIKPTDGSGDLTFTRNSNATRVNADGLVEKVRTNLFPTGSALLSTGWNSAGATLTAGQAGPDGGTGALRVEFTTGTSYIYQAFGGLAIPYTRSLYIKGASAQSIKLAEAFTGQSQIINITTSWQRFDFTSNGVFGGVSIQFDNTNDSAAKDFTVSFIQIEEGDIATDYIATTSAAVSVGPTANVPRLDYSGGASCCSLLLESQRTNLALFSESFDNATGWALFNSATITANSTISPDGYQNADTLNFGASSTSQVYSNVGASTGTYSFSVYAKSSTGKKFRFKIATPSGDTFSSDFTTTSEWQRFTFNHTDQIFHMAICNESAGGVGSIQIWGAQLEAGSYATSYIPTLGASVTRLADATYKTGISSLIGQTEGTLFVEVSGESLQENSRYMSISDFNDPYKRLTIYQTGGVLNVYCSAGAAFNLSYNPPAGPLKIAVGYKSGDYVLYVNGVNAISSSEIAVVACSDLGFGVNEYLGTANPPSVGYKQALLFKTRLTNAQLAELTTL